MRILWLALECAEPLFSGNGTLSRSMVPTLLEIPNVQILVVCAVADDQTSIRFNFETHGKAFTALTVKIPASKWRSLRRDGSWKEYNDGVIQYQKSVQDFNPDVVVGIDWHSLGPYKNLFPDEKRRPPYVYLNFRAFHASPGFSEEELKWYAPFEKECCDLASKTVTLGTPDAKLLKTLSGHEAIPLTCTVSPHIVDIANKINKTPAPPREYFLCCCRISQEKTIERFISVVEKLSRFLKEQNIRPFLCGARSDPKYTEACVSGLKKAFPDSVIVDFLSMEQLCEVYRKTWLNFHPALYEAYGLTMVEAGLFGAPSIAHHSDDIGALDFLSPARGEIFTEDLTDLEKTTVKVKELLCDKKNLNKLVPTVQKGAYHTQQENIVKNCMRFLNPY
eukprot:TRINITY_DN2481_c0_g1_i2.p1 TRINITY_DN2481_c0_g1~~TRINITY_DN2481_c0_g1_i2.p1  ORF type:complete len:392 (+),score=76.28 TRINITY_DN2481_c0_g1_i2:146-1321(+)